MFSRRHVGSRVALAAVVGLVVVTAVPAAEPTALPPATKKKVDFVRDIKPLLTTHCHKCHGASKQEGGLRLDRRDEALNGGDSGPAFVSGKSAESLLIKYVAGVDPDVLMPPEGDKLSDEEIGLLRGWIDQGADWPKDDKGLDQRAAHWSFQPVRAPSPPVSSVAILHPVDAFVREGLASRGLTPSPETDRPTLMRRLSLDLLGLPPRPDETAEFLGDERPDACERMIDRLLASPHFGERWGRHWLDLARYADSDGYEKDLPRPHAWRWRDWVIDAFNRDLPFDQFTVEQLAGDLLPGATLDQRIATGFHRNTLTNKEGGADKKEDRDKQLVDRTNTTGAAWLGLTVGCAQCHSHKYDPISHREYYQLYAFFNAADEQDIPVATAAQLEQHARLKAIQDVSRQPLLNAVVRYRETTPADALSVLEPKDKQDKADPELQKLEAALAKFDAAGPKPPAELAMVLSESAKPSPTNIHVRGDFLRLGAEVQPAGLSALNPLKVGSGSTASERSSAAASRPNRLDLARWIVDESNPLTRRVAVNRIWQHLFGRGLVDPPDDFGLQGAKPSHPDLLDWLATELPRRGWSRKEIIRLIATSAAYRQSSRTRPELNTIDPKNVWLARQNRFRLEGEIVRDLALSVSGLLDDRIGGESIRPPLPSGVADLGYAGSVKWVESKGGDRYRRGCYIFFQRTVPYPLLMTFDSSDSNVSCARRERSNTPLQSLTLLNDPAFFECARAFGIRLDTEVTGDPTTRSRTAFRWTTGRELELAELETLVRLYEETRSQLQRQPNDAIAIVAGATTPSGSSVDLAASIAFSRILLNLDEFFTRE